MLLTVPVTGRCRVDLLTSERDWAELQPEWNTLAGHVPMHGYEWATIWWRHYRTRRTSLWLLAVRDEQGTLIGIAPWYLHESPLSGRTIRFLGSGEACADYLTLLCQEEHLEIVSEAIAEYLLQARDAWDTLDLEATAVNDPSIALLTERLASAGHQVHRQTRFHGWRLSLPETWDAYLATLSKSRRERTRKLIRDNLGTGRATLRSITDPGELSGAFDLLIDLHQKRRASVGEDGCFRSQRFTAFHRELCQELLRVGQLRFLTLEMDGEPIVAEYGMTSTDSVFYYQGGFDPDYTEERPGWLSFAASLRLAIEQGYQYYDFMRGDEPYKASWKSEPIPLVDLRIVGTRRSARVRNAAWSGGRSVKGWVKKHVLRRPVVGTLASSSALESKD